jgi:hypothetical protein
VANNENLADLALTDFNIKAAAKISYSYARFT